MDTWNHYVSLNQCQKVVLQLISSPIDGVYDSNECGREVITVAQLINLMHFDPAENVYRTSFPKFRINLVARRQSKNQETPILLFNSLKIYMTDQSRNLLHHFFHLGICVSYDRVLEITKNIYKNLHLSYFSHNCWFPNILKKVFLRYC